MCFSATAMFPAPQEAFPSEPTLAVEKAVADGLTHALGDENMNLNDVVCSRDFSQLCPEGVLS